MGMEKWKNARSRTLGELWDFDGRKDGSIPPDVINKSDRDCPAHDPEIYLKKPLTFKS
jgi:hypothetical protein